MIGIARAVARRRFVAAATVTLRGPTRRGRMWLLERDWQVVPPCLGAAGELGGSRYEKTNKRYGHKRRKQRRAGAVPFVSVAPAGACLAENAKPATIDFTAAGLGDPHHVSRDQSKAAPTIILRIRIHGEPCEIEFVCVGCPFASPPVPNFL